ncbi:hypothetical protein K9M79_01725 [Candidatus Woesearchaeota archaeon]|nr:hypothetical protein [Candidatus Woesearchaeota archaeon]
MKKIIVGILVILMSFLVLAQGQLGIQESSTMNLQMNSMGHELSEGQRGLVQEGYSVNQMGNQMIMHEEANNRFRLEVGGVSAHCPFNITQERFQNRTRLYAGLSNGRYAEIKIMPDTASEMALQRLKLKKCDGDCQIELKEVGEGNQTRIAYEVRTQENRKVFGLFRANMNVQAQVNAESGEFISMHKPWWAFMTTG